METVTVTYNGQKFDVLPEIGRVTLWWIQGNRWGQDIYRSREIKDTDRRYNAVMALAKETV